MQKNKQVKRTTLYSRAWRERNPERYLVGRKKFGTKYHSQWRKKNPDLLLANHIRNTVGDIFSLEKYKIMNKKQKNKCKICKNIPKTRLYIDHCHKNGNVRGLLCLKCNVGLGNFKDNPKIMQNAIKYLKP